MPTSHTNSYMYKIRTNDVVIVSAVTGRSDYAQYVYVRCNQTH